MAYFIFLKSLRSLGEFRKILISKFLLNLLVQISKALVYSKIKFYSEKNFSRHFRPIRPFGPVSFFFTGQFSLPFPLGLGLPASPAHPHGPTGHLSSSSHTEVGRAWRRCWPASSRLQGHPDASTRREKRPHLIPLHFPNYSVPSPTSSIMETGAIEAPSSRQLKALDPPLPRLRPIKADPSDGEASHTSNTPSPSPHRALVVVLLSRGFRRW
jgi:hypothetical protein